MKKTLLYSLAAFAALGLASCSEDYDDWANPQSYGQDAAAAKYGLTFAAVQKSTALSLTLMAWFISLRSALQTL